jgi:ketosteroid isomerase-like protein
MTTNTPTNDEADIRRLLDGFSRALHDKDAHAAITPLAEDCVNFDLAPPLRQGPEATHDPAGLNEWFATWDGPIVSQSHDLKIEADGDIAYAYCLQHMTGTKTDGVKADLWFRATACFRREPHGWRITHMHNSVPFAMDGSDRALLNLKP